MDLLLLAAVTVTRFLIVVGQDVAPPVGPEPEFAEPIPNITISAGRDVNIPCVVDNLQNYRVAWIHTDRFTLLTLQNRVITRNSRYRVTHNGQRTWWLHIADVHERDQGEYMCQINTSPMKHQVGYLIVVVPPQIDEVATSSDTEVREGTDVSLRCVAKGSPEPDVTWRREDNRELAVGKTKVSSVKGEFLNITKPSRLHMGPYLCIAGNGVPPSVSKRIVLSVNFAPMIWIPNQLVGAPLGSDVTLDCNLESHPRSVTYWTRQGGVMIISNIKYETLLVSSGLYKVQMKLRINHLRPEDFGPYTCVAKNSLGETEGTIRLYEIPPASSTSSQGPEAFKAKSEMLRNGFSQSTFSKPEEKQTLPSASSELQGSEGGTEDQPSSPVLTHPKPPSAETSAARGSAIHRTERHLWCSLIIILLGMLLRS